MNEMIVRAPVPAPVRSPAGRIHLRELQIAKAELYELAESMLRTKRTRRGRMRVAQFLGVGRELLDEIARRPFDPEASGAHLSFDDEAAANEVAGQRRVVVPRPKKTREPPPEAEATPDRDTPPASQSPAPEPPKPPEHHVESDQPTNPIRRKPKVTRD